jgi:putative transcriptional regulator
MITNMAIMINLDVMMAKRKVGLTELAGDVDITLANLSILKNNKAKAVRLATLDAICKALNCQPGDILEYVPDEITNENSMNEGGEENGQ